MRTSLLPAVEAPAGFTLRHDLQPGDLGSLIHLHGSLYAKECNFDATFEAYVAGPMAQFVCRKTARDRLWIAEAKGKLKACIAIVNAGEREAQLRWFLVDPSARGKGLGKHLLGAAITFSKLASYQTIFLWTVQRLAAAAHLYQTAGFHLTESKPGKLWGADVNEERYVLHLNQTSP